MKKRINIQLMTIAVIAIFTTMLLVATVCYDLFRGKILEDLKTYASLLEDMGKPEQREDADGDLQKMNLRVTVIGADGEVIYENHANAEEMGNHKERPEIRQAFSEGEGQAVRQSSTMKKNLFYYAVRMENGNVLRVSTEAESLWSVFEEAMPSIIVVMLILIGFCMALTHFLTKSLIEPIERIAQNADDSEELETYEELAPFIATIRKQHEDILKNAGMRQEFTANVSHELKTPLTSISGYAELIENGMASPEDTVRFAKEIHRNSNRLLTLINDVIRLSELDVMERDEQPENVDLYEVAEICVNMLQVNADNHGVTLQLEGEPCHVLSEKQMMEELVYNLCDNAIRYNNQGGRVLVTVREDADFVMLKVEDTGIGIPKEHQERIFERFYRVDKSRSKSTGGTGLGLAIVKHIVSRSNAEIRLKSEEGKGTQITVIFPKRQEEN